MFESLLDQDQYTLTQQQAILKLGFASVPVKYRFKCRTPNVDLSKLFVEIREKIYSLRGITLQKDEYSYLRSLRYFKEEYLNFLKFFKYDIDLIRVELTDTPYGMDITVEGPWFNTIVFEIPILYCVSETYANHIGFSSKNATTILADNMEKLPKGFKFADFGTRRRADSTLHDISVGYCYDMEEFVGTSNLYLAKQYGIKAIGTNSHQWYMAHQQLNYRVIESQKMALENWVKVYRGDLGIALADTINTESFLKDFDDPFFYKLFDGVRDDSSPDPILFGHQIINFYLQRGIDPKKKTIVYSNGLSFDKAIKIYYELHNLINLSFGIGTKFTNDTGSPTNLDIVMKMVECNHQPVAKLSNEPGKGMCENPQFLAYLKNVFQVE